MTESPESPPVERMMVVFAILGGLASIGIMLAAGALQWSRGWTYLALFGAQMAISSAYLIRWNPEVLIRRSRLGKGTKPWDFVWITCISVRPRVNDPIHAQIFDRLWVRVEAQPIKLTARTRCARMQRLQVNLLT